MDKEREQVGGTHYERMKIQPHVYAEENEMSFLEGSVVKYVSRYKHKNGLQDLEKAKDCIDLLIKKHYL
jgi:hypothetical protein